MAVVETLSWLDEFFGPPIVQEEGVDLPKRTRINFIGADVTATDDATNKVTNVTIVGGPPLLNAGTGTLTDVVTTASGAPSRGIRFSGVAPSIAGLASGSDGRYLVLWTTGGPLVLQNESGSEATAANRILTGTGANITIADENAALLIYDGTSARWRVVSTGGSGGLTLPLTVGSGTVPGSGDLARIGSSLGASGDHDIVTVHDGTAARSILKVGYDSDNGVPYIQFADAAAPEVRLKGNSLGFYTGTGGAFWFGNGTSSSANAFSLTNYHNFDVSLAGAGSKASFNTTVLLGLPRTGLAIGDLASDASQCTVLGGQTIGGPSAGPSSSATYLYIWGYNRFNSWGPKGDRFCHGGYVGTSTSPYTISAGLSAAFNSTGPAQALRKNPNADFTHGPLFTERDSSSAGNLSLLDFTMLNESAVTISYLVTMVSTTTATISGSFQGKAHLKRTASGSATHVSGSPVYQTDIKTTSGDTVTFSISGAQVSVYCTAADSTPRRWRAEIHLQEVKST